MKNRMFNLVYLAWLCFAPVALWAQSLQLDVRLYSSKKVKTAVVTLDTGLYHLLAYNARQQLVDTIYDIFSQDPLRTFYLSTSGGQLLVKRGTQALGRYQNLRFSSAHPRKEFRIEARGLGRAYHGDIYFAAEQGLLKIINRVPLEYYVAGVVESEAGHVAELEFYKAQAVMARTFAIKNLNKHLKEGYNLKDDVSSQAYYSKAHYTHKDLIDSAVRATRDTLLVLENCQPILGVFHANSGGFTMNSEDVWLQSLPYLKAKADSFSVGVGSYQWEKTLDADQVYTYFARALGVKNTLRLQKAILNFDQNSRQSHFEYAGQRLKLTRVRRQFGLRSTFFSVEKEGPNIILKGKGFGHGVGLSQDGAIEMSRRGYNYRQILHHYYQNIELEDLQRLSLKEELFLP
jgi:stage II sporulation protein D